MGKSTKTKFLSDSDNELYSFHIAINNNQTNKLNFKNFNEIDKKLNLFEINKKGYLSLILKYLIITKNNIWLKLILNKYLNYLRINDCLLLIKYLDNEVLEGYNNLTPMGRMANPEEIAETILFACSDAASYMTADTIYVSGGLR